MPPSLDRAAVTAATEIFDTLGAAVADLQVYGQAHPRYAKSLESLRARVAALLDPAGQVETLFFHLGESGPEYQMIPLVGIQAQGERLHRSLIASDRAALRIGRGIGGAALDRLVRSLAATARGPRAGEPAIGSPANEADFELIGRKEYQALEALRKARAAGQADSSAESLSLPELEVAESTLGSILSTYQALLANVEGGRAFDYSAIDDATRRVASLFERRQASFYPSLADGYFDEFTFHHSVNVCLITTKVAGVFVTDKEVLGRISMAALLHDIGKMRVPKEIIQKPGKLTPGEAELMRAHPTYGAEILLGTPGMDPACVSAAYGHHINDGRSSYPKTVKTYHADWITQLISVVDIYEALTAVRPYKKALSTERAFDVMMSMPGFRQRLPIIKMLYDLMGPYPVGAVVELNSGERALVVKQNSGSPHAPCVRVTTDRTRVPVPIPWDLDLSAAPKNSKDGPPPRIERMIVVQSPGQNPYQADVDPDSGKILDQALLDEDLFLLHEG